MEDYHAASYQQDVMKEMSRQAQVYFYGPGFKGYDLNDSIDQVLAKVPFEPYAIVLGHSWLNDKEESEVDPHPLLQLSKTNISKTKKFIEKHRTIFFGSKKSPKPCL